MTTMQAMQSSRAASRAATPEAPEARRRIAALQPARLDVATPVDRVPTKTWSARPICTSVLMLCVGVCFAASLLPVHVVDSGAAHAAKRMEPESTMGLGDSSGLLKPGNSWMEGASDDLDYERDELLNHIEMLTRQLAGMETHILKYCETRSEASSARSKRNELLDSIETLARQKLPRKEMQIVKHREANSETPSKATRTRVYRDGVAAIRWLVFATATLWLMLSFAKMCASLRAWLVTCFMRMSMWWGGRERRRQREEEKMKELERLNDSLWR